MKYPEKTAIGDAGEYFFAYQIASALGWPCRLFDIDIGIDAQVEILDKERTSTGKFVAFQVKTTIVEGNDACRYVLKKQLSYWRDLDLPVFVVLVDLSKKAMYFHRIKRHHSYHETDKGLIRIDFDTKKDRFNKKSGALIKAAADEAALVAIREYLRPVHEGIDSIKEALHDALEHPDPESLIEIMRLRYSLKGSLARAETLALNMRVGEEECLHVEAQLEEALNALREFMSDWDMHKDWDDGRHGDGDIRKFLEE